MDEEGVSKRSTPERSGSGSQAFSAAAPAINLPKGGGAIRGIGEKFAANPVTGTGLMIVPIATSPGRSGFGPQLSLTYNSGADNDPFGFGWSLSLPSITRKTAQGFPQYFDGVDSDVFILSGVQALVPVLVRVKGGERPIFESIESGDILLPAPRLSYKVGGLRQRYRLV